MKKQFPLLVLGVVIAIWGGQQLLPLLAPKAEPIILTITMAESPYIEDISVNHYKQWLEEQTGYTLIFNVVAPIYSGQAVSDSITDGTLQTDILFSFTTQETDFFTPQIINSLGEGGYIYPLDSLLTDGQSLGAIVTDITSYDLASYLTAEDGHLYYAPQLDASKLSTADETLWININWLHTLDLSIPTTTAELAAVLEAFATDDPNGNGMLDEVPFASSDDLYPCRDYLINAFVYNDTDNYRFYADETGIQFAPTQDGWREAMIYLSSLYGTDGVNLLTSPLTTHQLSELTSSASDVLGAFTTNDVGGVFWNNHFDVPMRYSPVSPIATEDGISHATISTPLPMVGAVIPANASNPEAAITLLNLMLSPEASLIACYGEEGVDWEYASATDLDSQGAKASVVVHSHYDGLAQNKNFANSGPYYVYPDIADHVSYTNFDTAYLNNRGLIVQQASQPTVILSPIDLTGNQDLYDRALAIEDYTQQWLDGFCDGTYDPSDDAIWNSYLTGYEDLGLTTLLSYIEQTTSINPA
ncbi:hypothetical protein RFF05_01705 [Bengtsoniella intestinalis]|uniref:hypothetical protein n=1 Tax=Bengtsoniella intestinalis TaxID=3073143 RepID=UPI00391F64D2